VSVAGIQPTITLGTRSVQPMTEAACTKQALAPHAVPEAYLHRPALVVQSYRVNVVVLARLCGAACKRPNVLPDSTNSMVCSFAVGFQATNVRVCFASLE